MGTDWATFLLQEGIGDSENTKTTRQVLDNLNENLSLGGDYEEYAKDIGYDPANPITLKDVLRNSEKVSNYMRNGYGSVRIRAKDWGAQVCMNKWNNKSKIKAILFVVILIVVCVCGF